MNVHSTGARCRAAVRRNASVLRHPRTTLPPPTSSAPSYPSAGLSLGAVSRACIPITKHSVLLITMCNPAIQSEVEVDPALESDSALGTDDMCVLPLSLRISRPN